MTAFAKGDCVGQSDGKGRVEARACDSSRANASKVGASLPSNSHTEIGEGMIMLRPANQANMMFDSDLQVVRNATQAQTIGEPRHR